MTVIVLDGRVPDAVPATAGPLLAGPVSYTEEVPVRLVWNLVDGSPVAPTPDGDDRTRALLTTSAAHPVAAARIAAGEDVVEVRLPEGARLLDAVALMDRLRTNGAWEADQTHHSLTAYLVEETYELLDAIAAGERDGLVGELGDLLLQVLFHSRIGEGFTIDDVADAFIRKITARSAGVLAGGVDLATQVDDWERAKAAERPGASAMDGIAFGQPALALTAKVLERAAAAGIPDDVVPAELRTVEVGPGAEERLRAAVIDFVARVQAAEGITELGGPADELTTDEWRAALGSGDEGDAPAVTDPAT